LRVELRLASFFRDSGRSSARIEIKKTKTVVRRSRVRKRLGVAW